ncbi:MAG: hypothetical protein MZV49_13590 [Rhodopseudomonas palustris]|nr:hypothetical protein [Rhodopseudomonas palustris]
MAAGLAVFKQARLIPGVTLVGIFGKWLAVPLLGLPVFCQANAHLAILLNGACLLCRRQPVQEQRSPPTRKHKARVAGLAAFAARHGVFRPGPLLGPLPPPALLSPCRRRRHLHADARRSRRACWPPCSFRWATPSGGGWKNGCCPCGCRAGPCSSRWPQRFALACWGCTVLLTAAGF